MSRNLNNNILGYAEDDSTLRNHFQIISVGSANGETMFIEKFYIRFLK